MLVINITGYNCLPYLNKNNKLIAFVSWQMITHIMIKLAAWQQSKNINFPSNFHMHDNVFSYHEKDAIM